MNKDRKKLILIGDKGVGKTAFLNKLITGVFTTEYFPTQITDSFNYKNFEIYDHAILELLDMDCAIIITDYSSVKNVQKWIDKIGDTPFVVCVNKGTSRKIKKKITEYIEIDVKTGFNLEKPFQILEERLR